VEKEIPQRSVDVYEVKLLYYKPPVERPKPKRAFKERKKIVKEKVEEKRPPVVNEEDKSKEPEKSAEKQEEVQQETQVTPEAVLGDEIKRTKSMLETQEKSRDFSPIIQELREKLIKKKIYPTSARRRGQQGVVHVLVELDQEGNLIGLRITRSSGYKVLDNAAVSLVKKVVPFKHGAGRAIAIEIPINYNLLDQ
jgi:protein TonB